MPDILDLLLRLGQFSVLVVVACVAIMLFISMIDGHPRGKDPGDKKDRK